MSGTQADFDTAQGAVPADRLLPGQDVHLFVFVAVDLPDLGRCGDFGQRFDNGGGFEGRGEGRRPFVADTDIFVARVVGEYLFLADFLDDAFHHRKSVVFDRTCTASPGDTASFVAFRNDRVADFRYGLPGGGDPDGDRADRGQKTSGVEPEEGQLLPSDRIVRKSFCRNVARDRYGVLARDAAGDFVAFAVGDDAVRRHRRQNPGRFHGVVCRDEGPDFGVGRSDGQLHRSAPAFRIAESGHAGRGDEANVFPDHRGDVQGAGRGVVKPFGADPGAVPGAEYFQKQFRFRRVGERVGERAEYGGKHLRQRGECHVKTGLEVDDCVRSEIPCGRRCRGCGRSRALRFFRKMRRRHRKGRWLLCGVSGCLKTDDDVGFGRLGDFSVRGVGSRSGLDGEVFDGYDLRVGA